MFEIKLKVCGLRDNAYEVVTDIQPDLAGFIFYERSPRYIANMDFSKLPKSDNRVGVFVDADFATIQSKIEECCLSYVQLHGNESAYLCAQLKPFTKVVKVFSGNEKIDVNQLKAYEPFIDYYLFDTRSYQFGGTGKTFDWNKLEKLSLGKPIILSGGIGIDEVEQLKKLDIDIYAIDVNSKVEKSPGMKDLKLLRTLKEKLQ